MAQSLATDSYIFTSNFTVINTWIQVRTSFSSIKYNHEILYEKTDHFV